MLDFNNADQQSTGGPIPPDSCVILQVEIRNPRAGKQGSHPLLCRSDKGNEYLDIEFKVVRGSYTGKQIWQNFTVAGSEQASKISMRTLRAIVESARQINPQDQTPQAVTARQLSDWADFQGMMFMAKVGCEVERNQRDGRDYVNNSIKRVITPDMDEYKVVAQNGEIITDKPIPQPGAAPASPSAQGGRPAAPVPAWGQPAAAAAPQAPAAAPAWGQPAVGKQEGMFVQDAARHQPTAATAQPATTSPSSAPIPAWAQK